MAREVTRHNLAEKPCLGRRGCLWRRLYTAVFVDRENGRQEGKGVWYALASQGQPYIAQGSALDMASGTVWIKGKYSRMGIHIYAVVGNMSHIF